jgi:hypothetical protein
MRFKGWLELDLADLDEGLCVGEMGEVGDDLGKAGAKGLLKRFEGIEIEVTNGEIGSGCTGHHAGKTLVDGGFAKSGAYELVDERDVLLAIVSDVEMISRLIGIKDTDFDHGGLAGDEGWKRSAEGIRQWGTREVKGRVVETKT